MALWNRLQTLDDEARTKLHDIYVKSTFPLEVRGTFAQWIEEQPWQSFDQSIPEHKIQAQCLVEELIKKLEDKSQSVNDLVTQMNYMRFKNLIKEMYLSNPWYFVESIQGILRAEKDLLLAAEQALAFSPLMDIESPESPAIPDVSKYIDDLKNILQKTDLALKNYKQQQEDFVIRYQEICKVDAEISQSSQQPDKQKQENMVKLQKRKTEIENKLKERALLILGDREEVFQQLENLSSKIDHVSRKVYEELFLWRMRQQRSLSGGEKPESLDDLQQWFESLTDTLWTLYQLCTQFKLLFDALPIIRNGDEKDKTEKVLERAVSSLTTLIQRSFIVDKQPPQVLKTQTKFQASVRLLVGTKLNLQMNCPEVTTTILSEKQAKELCDGKGIEDTGNCGEILNNRGVMEFNQALNALHADFKNLSLKKIKRQDRRGQESVLEAKSCLVFTAAITIGGERLPVMCMSVPVVVVVHGNQGPNSEATIFWDNFFSKPDRDPFEVPEEVPWEEMSIALNARWSMTAECDLTKDHLFYLGTKLFQNCDKAQADKKMVSWHAFNKEPLKNRNFTFWEWFHSGMDVVKKHLRDHWNDGFLEFMSRDTAAQKLKGNLPGTFIIRFSDGEIGGVSIAWVHGGDDGIWHLQPWTTKDFNIRSLADRIFDIDDMKYVYPGHDKEKAFGKFRSQDHSCSAPDPNGYVMASIVAKINSPESFGGQRMDSLPSPPSHHGSVDPPNPTDLLRSFPNLTTASANWDPGNTALAEACYDQNVMWVTEELEQIMENGENITPSIEEFMKNLEQ